MIEVQWRGIAPVSRERCRIDDGPDAVRVTGTIDRSDGRFAYEMTMTAEWRFRALVIGDGRRRSTVVRYDGHWTVNGVPRPDLADAREVDIAASPVSNTLPIRRLALEIGESADIVTAYVAVPGLTVAVDPQRYTRLSEREYHYASRDSDFRRIITVDDVGLVVSYPCLFQRLMGE